MRASIKLFFGTILLSAFLTGCINNKLISEGQLAFQHQDYHIAYQKLLNAAQAGNSRAQYAVGYMLYNGLGVTQNQPQALTWFKKAADKGSYRAMVALDKLNAQAERASYNLPEINND